MGTGLPHRYRREMPVPSAGRPRPSLASASAGWIRGDAALASRMMRRSTISPLFIGFMICVAMIVVSLFVYGIRGGSMSDLPDHSGIHHGGVVIGSPLIVAVGMGGGVIGVTWLAFHLHARRRPVAVASLWHDVTLVADPAKPNLRIDVIVFDSCTDRTVPVPAWHAGRWCAAMLHVRGGWIRLEGFRALTPDVVSTTAPPDGGYDSRARSLWL